MYTKFLLELKVIDVSANSLYFLKRALYNNNINALHLLIRHNVDLQCFDESGGSSSGTSAIHMAAQWGHTEAVELLIKAGVSPDHHHPKNKLTPLMIAAFNGHEDVVRLLLKYNANTDIICSNGLNALGFVSCLGNVKIASLLLEAGAEINLKLNGYTALYFATFDSYHEVVELLLRFNADPNIPANDGATPLMIACSHRQKKIVKLLLQAGAYVDLQGKDSFNRQTALHVPAYDNDTEILSLLLNANANVNIQNIDGYTPMHFICFNGNEEMVQRFLSAGADVNLCSHKGESPLHPAVYSENTKIAETLLNAGADPNLASENNYTSLHLACMVGNKRIVQLLIKAKAVINTLSTLGYTPLCIAAGRGHTEIVEMLLTAGASTELQSNSRGWTPIFFAAAGGHSEIVSLLLEHKAIIRQDINGKDLLFVASSMGHPEIETILRAATPSKEKDTTINVAPLVNTDDQSSNNISSYYNSYILSLSSRIESARKYIKNSLKRLENEMESWTIAPTRQITS